MGCGGLVETVCEMNGSRATAGLGPGRPKKTRGFRSGRFLTAPPAVDETGTASISPGRVVSNRVCFESKSGSPQFLIVSRMNDSYGFVSENNSITISNGPFSHPKGKDSRPLFHSLQANISDVPFFISV